VTQGVSLRGGDWLGENSGRLSLFVEGLKGLRGRVNYVRYPSFLSKGYYSQQSLHRRIGEEGAKAKSVGGIRNK